MADVGHKLGASLQLGESLVSRTQKNKSMPNDADPASMSALTSGQTDLSGPD